MFASGGGGAGFSAVQSMAEPWQRATAVAVVVLTTALVGFGIGPVIVGMLSDYLTQHQGKDALRPALLVTTLCFLWSSVHYFLGARGIPK
jgi:hypothetical protein